jgi:hypothetical protein
MRGRRLKSFHTKTLQSKNSEDKRKRSLQQAWNYFRKVSTNSEGYSTIICYLKL